MAENESFFRKVVRFVANPATDWTELNSRQDDNRELEVEKSELKAMIERKRRNDFVRKREFDMLRRVRREGLSPEQLAALGTSSRLDDSEARLQEGAAQRPDGVKAKIDEIEQQMVGDGFVNSSRSRPAPLAPPASLCIRFASLSSSFDEPPSAASCSLVSPSRRTRRSMSNSRLRTKSLRRLRSIIAFSSDFANSFSRRSSGDTPASAHSVVGLATNRTTLRKKLELSFESAMGAWRRGLLQRREPAAGLSRRTSSA